MNIEKLNKKLFSKIPLWSVALAVLIVLCVLGIVLISGKKNKEDKTEIVTKSTLEKIINVSELSTYEAVYNGVAKVMNDKKTEKIDYHVYYEARVKAGIDFENVEIDVDSEAKKITVDLPDVKITDVNVDITSLDYIFENNKANTETVSEEAYKACIEDVTNESSNEDAIYELAEQNAKNIIEALIMPFVKQLDTDYVLEIN
ncbi:MAG: DUF4230 domain-containing protein [Lachnospiraceae bacterium]|nr:DUF4230 domain-containing protein [Lachnospiraceae bacterium]